MRRFVLHAAIGLCLVPLAELAPAADKGDEGVCRFGTHVQFVSTPTEAAREAKKDEKLVFVLHVSGHFEDPRFT